MIYIYIYIYIYMQMKPTFLLVPSDKSVALKEKNALEKKDLKRG